ncbi:dTDP-4-dehydrorhamnose reductase [Ramlibacter henchirensis]|uniref:dTDP-4-dehydrorhamnose reductase n=1 Tax=Ramlibacter henchirensis TaxID=204072 RepID=A0A4Z0C404_9BURK|nr:dTDP-4-dehydrorhamnose reductase [Ramlibacter henchirensis]TFZ05200.1 dTDP-4-dehydrorhamnose reductase [Ramlibacter henchirensis]
MKILLFGANGQVGWQLRRSLAVVGEVIPLDRSSTPLCGDLRDAQGVAASVADVAPDVVVNAAAYTAVDRAEDEPDAAFAVNASACDALAKAATRQGAWLVHYSSDYVYDGSGEKPWRETDATRPSSIYGRSKLAGDQAIAHGTRRHLVLRTSWVFDSWGQNFASSILKAAAVRDELTVVADQWGAPTRAALIADVTAHALRVLAAERNPERLAGIYHVAAGGSTNWHEYAQLIVQEANARGWPLRASADRVRAIASADYPARATRPKNSRLDTTRLRETFGLALPPWQDGVRAVIAELAQHRAAAST